jgi:hypothetical protein
MANAVYPKYKEVIASTGINFLTANIKAVLVDTASYTYSASHQFLSDIPGGMRVATSPNLTTKSVTNGIYDADDIVFSTVTGAQSEAVVLYVDTGSAATSNLILYLDTGITGLPVTPSGGNINVVWDNGANKIFAL